MTAAGPVSSYKIVRNVAVLTIDNPPVNALGHRVRLALSEGVARALADNEATALVIACAGRTFFAGADITELGKPIAPPLLADVMAQFESSPKPIVSAMHGTALGGGLEIALAGHYRVAVPSAVIGLPEVALGLLPGAGGTQRVPRLAGVEAALDMIGHGRQIKALQALNMGLIDAVVEEGRLEEQAVEFAGRLVASGAPLKRARDMKTDLSLEAALPVFDRFRADNPQLFTGLQAAEAVLEAIKAAITLPFDQGIERERELARALTASPESAAQRHLFFAERAAGKLKGAEKEKSPSIAGVTVSGEWSDAGALRQAGVPEGPKIHLLADAADLNHYKELVAASTARIVVATRHLDCFAELAASCPEGAALVGLSGHRGVWEIMVGAQTSPAAAMSLQALARKLRRTAIFVTPGHGVLLERLETALARGVQALLASGVAAADIAAAGKAYGFDARLLPAGDGEPRADVQQQLIAPVLEEASTLIRDGAVQRSSDLDIAAVKAGLWPLWRGGPAYQASLQNKEAAVAG